MPTPVSIRERIERQLLENLKDTPGIGACSRWDARGIGRYPHLGGFILAGDDRVDEAAMGNNYDVTTKTLDVTAGVVLYHSESATIPTAQLANLWMALVEEKIMSDPQLIETSTGKRLAVDIRCVGTIAPDYTQGRTAAGVRFEVMYDHYRDDPFAGPGLSKMTE